MSFRFKWPRFENAERDSRLGRSCALYIHVPFCARRCFYCDFYSVACEPGRDAGPDFSGYLKNILNVLDFYASESSPDRIPTVFIGGGTPSLLPADELASFLMELEKRIGRPDEVTMEVNPESLSAELLEAASGNGVNRLSMGVQTYCDSMLRRLGRPAGIEALQAADELLASSWDGLLSRDLLAALPRNPGELPDDIRRALADDPGHLSLYELTVEEGTPLARHPSMLGEPLDEDSRLEEWRKAVAELRNRGYDRYEVSNFAKTGRECRHNLNYWRMGPSLGIGPGAASTLPFDDGAVRTRFEPDLAGWMKAPLSTLDVHHLTPEELALEHLMMGLRTSEGLDLEHFSNVFGADLLSLVPKAVEEWAKAGMIEVDEALKPTPEGLDLVDALLQDMAVEADFSLLPQSLHWPSA